MYTLDWSVLCDIENRYQKLVHHYFQKIRNFSDIYITLSFMPFQPERDK